MNINVKILIINKLLERENVGDRKCPSTYGMVNTYDNSLCFLGDCTEESPRCYSCFEGALDREQAEEVADVES